MIANENNLLTLYGRIAVDPKQRDGKGWFGAWFTLAVDEYAGKDEGKKTSFIPMTWWTKSEKARAMLHKGQAITVHGHLSIDKYTPKGADREVETLTVAVDSVIMHTFKERERDRAEDEEDSDDWRRG